MCGAVGLLAVGLVAGLGCGDALPGAVEADDQHGHAPGQHRDLERDGLAHDLGVVLARGHQQLTVDLALTHDRADRHRERQGIERVLALVDVHGQELPTRGRGVLHQRNPAADLERTHLVGVPPLTAVFLGAVDQREPHVHRHAILLDLPASSQTVVLYPKTNMIVCVCQGILSIKKARSEGSSCLSALVLQDPQYLEVRVLGRMREEREALVRELPVEHGLVVEPGVERVIEVVIVQHSLAHPGAGPVLHPPGVRRIARLHVGLTQQEPRELADRLVRPVAVPAPCHDLGLGVRSVTPGVQQQGLEPEVQQRGRHVVLLHVRERLDLEEDHRRLGVVVRDRLELDQPGPGHG